MIDDYFVNLILQVLTLSSLPDIAPIKAQLFKNSNNYTQILFGVNSINLNNLSLFEATVTDKINQEANSIIVTHILKNTSPINFGVALDRFYGVLEFRIIDKNNNIISRKTYNASIDQSAQYRIPTGFLEIGVSKASVNLSCFLLDYLITTDINNYIKSPSYISTTNNVATTWELLVNNQLIIDLDKIKFSKLMKNIIGQIEISYGDSFVYQSPVLSQFQSLAVRKKNNDYNDNFDYFSSGRTWFNLKTATLSNSFAPEQNIEIFNNSLNFVYEPDVIKTDTVILEEDSNCKISISFDGYADDTSMTLAINQSTIEYRGEQKLFNSQSAVFGVTTSIEYNNFMLPNIFTLQFFFRFAVNPIGRDIFFFGKDNVIKVEKLGNNIRLSLFSDSFDIPCIPSLGIWYHLQIIRNGTNIRFILADSNQTIDQTFTLSSNFTDNITAVLKINDITKPMSAYVSGFYLNDVVLPFDLYKEPIPKYRYFWEYVPSYAWISPYFKYAHWEKLNRSKV